MQSKVHKLCTVLYEWCDFVDERNDMGGNFGLWVLDFE